MKYERKVADQLGTSQGVGGSRRVPAARSSALRQALQRQTVLKTRTSNQLPVPVKHAKDAFVSERLLVGLASGQPCVSGVEALIGERAEPGTSCTAKHAPFETKCTVAPQQSQRSRCSQRQDRSKEAEVLVLGARLDEVKPKPRLFWRAATVDDTSQLCNYYAGGLEAVRKAAKWVVGARLEIKVTA